MKRKNVWIEDEIFEKVVDNIKPYSDEDLNNFWEWLDNNTKLNRNEVSENGFYFSVVSIAISGSNHYCAAINDYRLTIDKTIFFRGQE